MSQNKWPRNQNSGPGGGLSRGPGGGLSTGPGGGLQQVLAVACQLDQVVAYPPGQVEDCRQVQGAGCRLAPGAASQQDRVVVFQLGQVEDCRLGPVVECQLDLCLILATFHLGRSLSMSWKNEL